MSEFFIRTNRIRLIETQAELDDESIKPISRVLALHLNMNGALPSGIGLVKAILGSFVPKLVSILSKILGHNSSAIL